MKKLLILVALLAVAAIPSFAQFPGYMITSFSNNTGPGGAADQLVRLVNFGALGTPLTSPTGDLCAVLNVFDANQELIACCACRITPNGLRTLSVANNLTNNPLTSVVPANGDIKIIAYDPGGLPCNPLNHTGFNNVNGLVGYSTHLQTSGGTAAGTFITETQIPPAYLSADEGLFMLAACQYARYLGSGKGTCSCGTGS